MNRKRTSQKKVKSTQSTFNEFVKSLSPKEKKEFDEGYKDLLLSEIVLAAMAKDELSVRELAKMAGVSPTIIQTMRSGSKNNYSLETFYKILKSLGYNQFMVGRDGQFINIDFSQFNKK